MKEASLEKQPVIEEEINSSALLYDDLFEYLRDKAGFETQEKLEEAGVATFEKDDFGRDRITILGKNKEEKEENTKRFLESATLDFYQPSPEVYKHIWEELDISPKSLETEEHVLNTYYFSIHHNKKSLIRISKSHSQSGP